MIKVVIVHHSPKICWLISIEYRFDSFRIRLNKIQIFLRLTNLCFQTYILRVIQFNGATLLIAILYLKIMFRQNFHTTFGLSLTSILLAAIILTILDMGSQPILKSSKLLENWKLCNQGCNCRWARKFLRTCPKVVLSVGSFYALDRKRAPNLMRFVLQRTFFLVKSTGDISGISMSIPKRNRNNILFFDENHNVDVIRILYVKSPV